MPPRRKAVSSSSSGPKRRKKQETYSIQQKPLDLRYDDEDIDHSGRRTPPARDVLRLVPPKPEPFAEPSDEDLIFMVLDILEGSDCSQYYIWGCTEAGRSVLLRIDDFRQYFYVAAPYPRNMEEVESEMSHTKGEQKQDMVRDWFDDSKRLIEIRSILNRYATSEESKIDHVEPVIRRPMLYYRPDKPDGEVFLRCWLCRKGNIRKASSAVLRSITDGTMPAEWDWKDHDVYESEVAPLQRFLTDVPCCGGAWLQVPKAHTEPPLREDVSQKKSKRGKDTSVAEGDSHVGKRDGYVKVSERSGRISKADIEARVSDWRCITCLSPDAIQLSSPDWNPIREKHATVSSSSFSRISSAWKAAVDGAIAPLRLMAMDVCLGVKDGKDRVPVPSTGDPITCISCILESTGDFKETCGQDEGQGSCKEQQKRTAKGVDQRKTHLSSAPPRVPSDDTCSHSEEKEVYSAEEEGEEDVVDIGAGPTAAFGESSTAVEGPSFQLMKKAPVERISFVFVEKEILKKFKPHLVLCEVGFKSHVFLFASEADLLLTWHQFLEAYDPDVIVAFQLENALEAIQQRWKYLRLGKGDLFLSRYLPDFAAPVSMKKVTMYSAAWVRAQTRMSSISNQETFRADNVDGRIVIDILRHIISTANLASFSLADAVQNLLGETLEVLPAHVVSHIAGFHQASTADTKSMSLKSSPVRLASYSLRRVSAIRSLLYRLATIPECIEMARATGLTLQQVVYKAQMIRTWSLLLRAAGRAGTVLPSRPESDPLQEHTYILHPVEEGTTGLHHEPVAILDFASLYPSIFIAYNLCYSTLLHPEDVAAVPRNSTITTPCRASFVNPSVRRGILPDILAALISARKETKKKLESTTSSFERDVLDSRQKALKVTANALYGFTGAQASPLQCVAIADSCLGLGATCCRMGKAIIEEAAARGDFGGLGKEAKVIYGHTDSLFLSLPKVSKFSDAVRIGHKASKIVSSHFPDPLELRFERVAFPLLLLHVNRYAGRTFTHEDEGPDDGKLLVRGIRSMWRQTAPFLRSTLHGCLVRILMQQDIHAALKFASNEIHRLLSGKVTIFELVMTGGLWRVTGEQIGRAAAAEEDEFNAESERRESIDSKAGAQDVEEMRGPHASLAVRLSRRDPGRRFVLGERLQYVLTAGHRLQDDAAEDPLLAAKHNIGPDFELYWKNKLQKPLIELFAPCVSSQQLKQLLNGPHTRVKVDVPINTSSSGQSSPSSPMPSMSSPGKSRSRQLGLMSFYKANPKCVRCRRSVTVKESSIEEVPGLCSSCSEVKGAWEQAWLQATSDASAVESRACAAYAACRECHSGLLQDDVLCENGECPITYVRLQSKSARHDADVTLKRLDASCRPPSL